VDERGIDEATPHGPPFRNHGIHGENIHKEEKRRREYLLLCLIVRIRENPWLDLWESGLSNIFFLDILNKQE